MNLLFFDNDFCHEFTSMKNHDIYQPCLKSGLIIIIYLILMSDSLIDFWS